MPIDLGQRRALDELAAGQAGLVSRSQVAALGIGPAWVRSQLTARRWRRVHAGVYATFTGPLPDLARVWAAVLYAGPGAVAAEGAAAWLTGLADELPARLVVLVPHGRTVRSIPGVRVRQCRDLASRRHPSRTPPCTAVEPTVLDLVDQARVEVQVVDVVLRACQRRLTTPTRLRVAADQRPRLRWRRLVHDVLVDAQDGVASPLERRYLRDVERAHGLPRGSRNRPEGPVGRRRYRDVRYRRWRLVVELDGAAAHPVDQQEYDDLRDNEVARRLERTLRFGWRSVTGRPCFVAAQVVAVLQQGGWTGPPTPCGPACALDSASAEGIWLSR